MDGGWRNVMQCARCENAEISMQVSIQYTRSRRLLGELASSSSDDETKVANEWVRDDLAVDTVMHVHGMVLRACACGTAICYERSKPMSKRKWKYPMAVSLSILNHTSEQAGAWRVCVVVVPK